MENLVNYYNQELAYVRRLAAEFAKTHPKIASRLRISDSAIADPHIERLIQAFAFLNARIQAKLDDDFPQISDSVLNVLYPHFQAPIPSMSIVRMQPRPDLTECYRIPRHTQLQTVDIDSKPCHFKTSYATELWPIAVKHASALTMPLKAPALPSHFGVQGALRLGLKLTNEDMTFAQLSPNKLRFYLAAEPEYVNRLYELIFSNTVQVALATSAGDKQPVLLGADCIKPVGFSEEQGLLPYPERSALAYRLLTEFFAFPKKFLFFELTGLTAENLEKFNDKLEIYLYFNQPVAKLEGNIHAKHFVLGCTPVVNLFKQQAEPIRLSRVVPEYRITPDASDPDKEIYTIRDVTLIDEEGDGRQVQPFYGVEHGLKEQEQTNAYWIANREPQKQIGEGFTDPGGMFISLVDLQAQESIQDEQVIDIHCWCTNGDVPNSLPFGGGQPELDFASDSGPVLSIQCLSPFTPTRYPKLKAEARWQLVSHLSLNYLSLRDSELSTSILKEILKLYDFLQNPTSQAMVDGINTITTKQTTTRIGNLLPAAFCQGTEVIVELDEDYFTDKPMYLFASVLEHFFGLYCSMNSFTQLVLTTKQSTGEIKRWPPRAGDKSLL